MNEIYEEQSILAEYLLFHYGANKEILPAEISWPEAMHSALGFAMRTPCHFSQKKVERGLDLGCAVGRSSFEMTRFCQEVLAMDYSQSFVSAAQKLAKGREIEYKRKDEGHLSTTLRARVPSELASDQVRFFQGDAMNLPSDIGEFDCVHAANLLCRLHNPTALLNRLPHLVKYGGELVLATPCTWLEDFTPSENWPEGDTLDWLKKHLGEYFSLEKTCDEPFLIRETSRKFQWTRSMVSVWKRK